MLQTKVVDKITNRYAQYMCLGIVPFIRVKWKSIVDSDRPLITIWHMRITCWIPQATNTPSEYVILIAFPQKKMGA
jgi:hypothetical protein